MKKFLLSCMVLLSIGFTASYAQESGQVFTMVDEMPVYPGCDSLKSYDEMSSCTLRMISKFISQEIRYPEEAKKKKAEGTVYVEYIIEESGEVTNVQLMGGMGRNVDESLNHEAVRVVSSLPQMKPGRKNGKAVRVKQTLPIRFRINSEDDKD
ncbi:MAG: energy transducer TonB [Flavobacteriales bacterium]|nr:energy transducer TonB [Flavobacteriales bacterium]